MRARRDDEGSIIPLILGYGLLISAVLLVGVVVTDMYTAQRRVDGLADAAALAAADGFVLEAGPVARLDEAAARVNAEAVISLSGQEARLIGLDAPDATTVRVSVAGAWHPPLATALFPEGVLLGATGTARTAIR